MRDFKRYLEYMSDCCFVLFFCTACYLFKAERSSSLSKPSARLVLGNEAN